MGVDGILRAKGTRVATIKPDATVVDLLRGLRDEGIGAMVVSDDGYHLDGIVSERDVVRALARVGARVLQQPVSEIMSTEVMTCSPTDPVKSVMELMTRHRIRHLPVMVKRPAGRDHQHRRRGEEPARRDGDRDERPPGDLPRRTLTTPPTAGTAPDSDPTARNALTVASTGARR